jgi:predicted ATPase with chaperone activity
MRPKPNVEAEQGRSPIADVRARGAKRVLEVAAAGGHNLQ